MILHYSSIEDGLLEGGTTESATAWAAALARFERALPYARRSRRPKWDRWHSLLGLALATEALAEHLRRPVEPGEFRFGAEGRPRLDAGPAFSISHCDAWVACVVADHGAIGLDVETETGCAAVELSLVCSPRELAAVGERGRAAMWTAKEAGLKAVSASVRRVLDVRVGEREIRIGASVFARSTLVGVGARADSPGFTATVATEFPAPTLEPRRYEPQDLLRRWSEAGFVDNARP